MSVFFLGHKKMKYYPVIPALRRQRQEDCETEPVLEAWFPAPVQVSVGTHPQMQYQHRHRHIYIII